MKKSFGTWFLLAVLVRLDFSAGQASCTDPPASFCTADVLDLLDIGISDSDKTKVTHLFIDAPSVVNLTNDALRAFANLELLSFTVTNLNSEDFMPNVFRDINISELKISGSMISFNQHFANVLNDLRSLTTLDLQNNKNLVSFHSAGITTFDRLTKLNFTADNIICDCELSWFRNYLINPPAKFDDVTQIRCNIAGTVKDIEESNFCSHSDMDPLTCVSCDGSTNEDCNSIATNETCSTATTITPLCMNTISNKGEVKSITKGCSTKSECNNIKSNTGTCFGNNPSRCMFCCRGNFCNHPETAILDGYYPQGYPFIPEHPTTQPLTSTPVITTTKMTTQLTTIAPTTTAATTPLQTTTSVPTTSVSTTETTTIQSTTPPPTTTYTTYVTTPIITPEITTATTKATTMMTTILTTTPQTTTVTTNPTTPSNDFETTFISTTGNKLTTTIPSTTTIPPTTSITTSTRPTTTTSSTTQLIPDTTTRLTTPTITTTPITTSQMTTTMTPGMTTSTPGTTTSTPGTTTSTPGTTTSTPGTTTSTPGTTTSTPGTTTSTPGTTTSTPGTTTSTPGTTTSTPGTTTSTPPTTTVAQTTTTMFTTTTEITSKPTTTAELSTTTMSSTQTEDDGVSVIKLTTTSKNDLTTEVVTTTPMVLYCEEEEEEEEGEEDGNYGEVEWPRTMVGLEVVVQCPFTRDGLPQNATRMCTLNGQSAVWMSPDYSNCITISQGLEILAQENVTTDNFMDVSEELVELTEESERLEEEDVENAVTVFEAVSMNLRGVENETEEVLDNLFVTVNQLLLAGETELMEAQMKAKTSSRIIQAVEETVMSVQIEGEDYISKSETFDVSIINVNEETRQSDIQFPKEESKKNGNTDDSNNDGDDDDGADDTITKIVIPKEAIKDATRVQFVLYKDTSFFQTITNTEETTTRPPCAEEGCLLKSRVLSSFVISASVGNQKISNLENKVTNTFYHVTDDKDQFTNNSQCVFWDFDAVNGRGDWSTDGCTVSATSNTTTTCECDHLTNFAVLLDIYGNAGEIPEDHRLIITYISIAGAGLSFISLVLALASYACAGRLRKDKRVKVLINLMTALLFMNMAFLFDVVVSELGSSHKYLCFGAAVAMHYTLLCVMTWMAVEAFTMYLALVQVFDSKRRRFMLKMCFLGWGLPAVIVGCSVWIDRENYGYENNLCYLKRIPFFISFFVPVCIVMIWNSVVYILVARQMHRLRKRQTKFNQTFSLTDQLRASFSLTFLLGLTWLFAFFAFGELNLTFTYLFAITNTLQGFVVFLLHCVFKREIRRQWQALCCPCIPLLKEGDDGTYSRSKTGTNGTSSVPNHSQNLPMIEHRKNRSKDTRSRSWFWRQSGRSARESTATDLTRLSATGSEFSPAGTINSNTTSVFA